MMDKDIQALQADNQRLFQANVGLLKRVHHLEALQDEKDRRIKQLVDYIGESFRKGNRPYVDGEIVSKVAS